MEIQHIRTLALYLEREEKLKNTKLIATRKESDKTQAQIAKECKISEVAYQNYEYGNREPRVRTAIRIAKALNKDVGDMEELFGGGNPGST